VLNDKFPEDLEFQDTIYDHEELSVLKHPILKEKAFLLKIKDGETYSNYIIFYPGDQNSLLYKYLTYTSTSNIIQLILR